MNGKKRTGAENGFEEGGGYMNVKKTKLEEQFVEDAKKLCNNKSNLFAGISIFVNGYTDPSADDLKHLIMEHGGVYHHYYRSGKTSYVIASNLPDSKLKQTQGTKFLKPSWIPDSIRENKVLDYREYLLYTNQSKTQPGLNFFADKYNSTINSKQSSTKNATDQEFLSEFYNNSRLHHISTMGAMFKQHINDLRSNINHIYSGKDKLLSRNPIVKEACDLFEISQKIIMHIDMDCFFVSVGVRDRPELKGLPIAVTHAKGNRAHPKEGVKKELKLYKQRLEKSDDGQLSGHWTDTIGSMDSMSEIASCSYEARAAGVKNGMFLGQALKLCPNLKPIPYDFEAYKEVSYMLYNTVASYTLDIEAVSCDEMYVDCGPLLSSTNYTPLEFATILRNEIKSKTRCPCSVGFGENRLQARIATKTAKPDGQFYLDSDPKMFFKNISVSDLPGVGYSTTYKLNCFGIKTCGDLQNVPLKKLQSDFGYKLGETLFNHCRGIDDKDLIFHQIRKSVSAEVNYGIRFQNEFERDTFLHQLSNEVSERVKKVKMKGKCITLKLMIRSKDAPEESAKFLGHGVCDQISKSSTLSVAVSDPTVIFREVLKIINKLKIDPKDLRGIGIQLTRLENGSMNSDNGLRKFFNNTIEDTKEKVENKNNKTKSANSYLNKKDSKTNAVSCSVSDLTLSKVDQSFLSALPVDIQNEIVTSLTRRNGKKRDSSLPPIPESDVSNDVPEQVNKSVESNSEDEDAVKSLVSPGELKNLLKQWIENEGVPHEEDISFVNTFLVKLVIKGHLEELSIILKYFHRFIQQFCKDKMWKAAYLSVLKNVQDKMVDSFNGRLLLEDQYYLFS